MPSVLPSAKSPTPYWQKFDRLDLADFEWNIPDRPNGSLLVVGGNSQIFAPEIKIGEFLQSHYPLQSLKLLLPDSLSGQIPTNPNLIFSASTPSGSFAESPVLADSIAASDAVLVFGDLTKNPVTAKAIAAAINSTETPPVLLTRDAVDLLAAELVNRPRLTLVASLAQLQKLLRALYYPKVLLLSMPILSVVELLHKFTLSYPTEIISFHNGFILAAKNGQVKSIPITKTSYSPLSLWQGQLAAKYLALQLYNPGPFFT